MSIWKEGCSKDCHNGWMEVLWSIHQELQATKPQVSASSSHARWAVLYACAWLVLPHGQSCSWHVQIGPRSCGRPGTVPPNKPVMWVGGKCLVKKCHIFSCCYEQNLFWCSIADMKFCVFRPLWRCLGHMMAAVFSTLTHVGTKNLKFSWTLQVGMDIPQFMDLQSKTEKVATGAAVLNGVAASTRHSKTQIPHMTWHSDSVWSCGCDLIGSVCSRFKQRLSSWNDFMKPFRRS